MNGYIYKISERLAEANVHNKYYTQKHTTD
jgi:hypothetical protein